MKKTEESGRLRKRNKEIGGIEKSKKTVSEKNREIGKEGLGEGGGKRKIGFGKRRKESSF